MPTTDRTTAPALPAPGGDPIEEPARAKSLSMSWLSRGLTIRVLAYTVGGHVFAGFLYLLFALGARQGH